MKEIQLRNRILTMFMVILLISFVFSMGVYFYTLSYPRIIKYRFEHLTSTDLSGILISGDNHGQNGIWGRLDLPATFTIKHNNERLLSIDDCIAVLGNNYLIVKGDAFNVIYLDQTNNIKLEISKYKDGSEYIKIDSIIETNFSKYIRRAGDYSFLALIFPGVIPEMYYNGIAKHYLSTLFDYIAIPIFFSAWMLPFINLIYKRTAVWCILSIVSGFYIFLSHGFIETLMSV